ncbi:MAG: hypothetical protein SF051_16045 [Elusimicrobiota bacterium]|nr:hypothetical protein [Elusimicrobiota bacterium]
MSPEPDRLFLSAARIDALAAFRSPEPDVLSLHLSVDDGGLYPGVLRQLFKEQAPRLRAFGGDLTRLERFVTSEFVPGAHRGLAVYSCAKRGLFEAFGLPQAVKTDLVADECLDLVPLRALRGQYYRYGALLAGPDGARFVEIFLGGCVELGVFTEPLDGVDALGRLAALTGTLARERRFDRLILGAETDLAARLAGLLDPGLQKDLILEPLLGRDRPAEAVLERVRHNEREARRVTESVLVHRLLDEARQGGAVTGLEAVAAALQQGCVSRVLVRDGFAKMGRACPACGHLSVDHRSCPWCFKPTDMVLDVVEELVSRALEAGCEVFRVMHDPRFDGICRIGAELKAPKTGPRPVPTSRALRGRFRLKDGRSSPLRGPSR